MITKRSLYDRYLTSRVIHFGLVIAFMVAVIVEIGVIISSDADQTKESNILISDIIPYWYKILRV